MYSLLYVVKHIIDVTTVKKIIPFNRYKYDSVISPTLKRRKKEKYKFLFFFIAFFIKNNGYSKSVIKLSKPIIPISI